MKIRVLITALTGLIFLSIGIAQAVPADGVYNGKILKSSKCKLSTGDQRACWSLTVQLDSGKVMEVRLWGFGAVIYNSNGKVLYKGPFDSEQDMKIKLYTAVGYLKKGVNVRMDNVSCGNSDELLPNIAPWCETSTIYIK